MQRSQRRRVAGSPTASGSRSSSELQRLVAGAAVPLEPRRGRLAPVRDRPRRAAPAHKRAQGPDERGRAEPMQRRRARRCQRPNEGHGEEQRRATRQPPARRPARTARTRRPATASQHLEPESLALVPRVAAHAALLNAQPAPSRATPEYARPRTALDSDWGGPPPNRSPFDQHLGWARARVVVGGHHRPVGAGASDRDQIARRHFGSIRSRPKTSLLSQIGPTTSIATSGSPRHWPRAQAAPGGEHHTSPAGSGRACRNRGSESAGPRTRLR